MKKLTTEEFVARAEIVHRNKYNYFNTTYKGKRKSIEITCKEHGSFNQNAGVHLNGSGCKKCAAIGQSKRQTLTTIDFIKKAKKIHGNKYDYSLVNYKNNSTKIKIICPKHGEFIQIPSNHLFNHGCDKCAREYLIKTKTLTTIDFIKKAKEIHGNKYDYSLVNYKNNSTKIKIICPKHGVFEQNPNSHISAKNGCSKCSGKSKITIKSLIGRAKEIHGNKYDYSLISNIKNSTTKVKIICLEHGEFMQTPDAHLNQKQGCPNCRESKGERDIDSFLKKNKILFIKQKTFDTCINPKTGRKLKFDFYLPSHNLCIEFDGQQHFKPIKRFGGEIGYNLTIYRDSIKNAFCKKNEIKLLRIKFNEKIINKLNKIKL
jgi:hypothetical protein